MSSPINVGFVGLGRMGSGLAARARADGLRVVGFDPDPTTRQRVSREGTAVVDSLAELVVRLESPRTFWIMVPAGKVTDSVISELTELVQEGDIIIDGGNSFYRDDVRHAHDLALRGIHFLDVGTSGGVWGLERGYCLMIGGNADVVRALTPLWSALAPGVEAAPRTRPEATITPAEAGWLHCGPSGAGHFVKMIHNGIEYGLMAAYAEGLNILAHANAGTQAQATDAETAPMMSAEFYHYNFDIPAIAELWRRGSVVSSWLLDLTAGALRDDPTLSEFAGRVSDSGEGRWTAIAAIEEGVPAPVLTAALQDRFASQGSALFAHQVLSAMRASFGGHGEKKVD